MDLVEFERLEQTFQSFHAHFASAFGRKQWRERARDYWRGLLVQAAERGSWVDSAHVSVEQTQPVGGSADTLERAISRMSREGRSALRLVTEEFARIAAEDARAARPISFSAVDQSAAESLH